MIPLIVFVAAVLENAIGVKEYHQPGDGSDGRCDCIGLIIGAKRLAGGKWTGTHGSNYAFRNEMQDTVEIKSADDFFLGEVVYKARNPGDAYYDLKAKYKKGGSLYNGDERDYYHVGVVTNVHPLEITHCTSPGPIVRDTKQGKWKYGGRLKDIDYGDVTTPGSFSPGKEDEKVVIVLSKATVKSANGAGVNLRAEKSKSSRRIDTIPEGAEVDVLESDGEWKKIIYNGKTGYVMSEFLTTNGDNVTLTLGRSHAEALYAALGQAFADTGVG